MLRITKDTLRQLGEAKGKLDLDSGQVFVGFVGRIDLADKMYVGEVHFSAPGEEPPADSISIGAILEPKAKQKPKVAKAPKETSDGDS
ncbi:MAG: hypothetical protein H8E44_07245 [Planctomycetes bacterium]|nr:hypothetical protein [Planctomycetota bacterium]